MSEVKPCPFCGACPKENEGDPPMTGYVRCDTLTCPLRTRQIRRDKWNERAGHDWGKLTDMMSDGQAEAIYVAARAERYRQIVKAAEARDAKEETPNPLSSVALARRHILEGAIMDSAKPAPNIEDSA